MNSMEGRDLLEKLSDNGLTHHQLIILRGIATDKQPCLLPLLDALNFSEGAYKCETVLSKLIGDLSKPSPVCNFLPCKDDIHKLLAQIINGDSLDVNEISLMISHIPILADIMHFFGTCPDYLKPIIRELEIISKNTFLNHTHKLPTDVNVSQDSFFPTLPLLCQRGKYEMDEINKSKCVSEKNPCTKRAARRRKYVPGMFHISCQHGEYLIISS